MTKLAIAGCAGRMGRTLMMLAKEMPGAELVAGSVLPSIEPPSGFDGVTFTSDAAELFRLADAVVDFTAPEASLEHAALAARSGKVLVVGTTGFTQEQEKQLAKYAEKAPIVWSYNMSLGVNLLAAITEKVAAALDNRFDIEIVEMHHRMKKDAPSGTALLLGRAAAAGRGVALEAVKEAGRAGITGERERGAIGFASLRGGDVVGDHTVIFAGDGERIELTHKAETRDIFARGALRAALWAQGKTPGLYSMRDVLGV